tara:strand:- start:190 stop:393 length:204 start_codon:yes stop_codon:yes gene_type:complete
MSTVVTKASTINKLMAQEIITIECASRILTRTADWIVDVCDLHNDGAIDTAESICLLTESSAWYEIP